MTVMQCNKIISVFLCDSLLRCFNTVGWVTGRATDL